MSDFRDRRKSCLLQNHCSAYCASTGEAPAEPFLLCPLHRDRLEYDEPLKTISLRHCYALDQVELWEKLQKGDLQ